MGNRLQETQPNQNSPRTRKHPLNSGSVTRDPKSNKVTTTLRHIARNGNDFYRHEPEGEYRSSCIQCIIIPISAQFWVSRDRVSVRVGINVGCSAPPSKEKPATKLKSLS